MAKSADPRRCWRRLHEWPENYRALWLAATEQGDDLDAPGHGQTLRPASLATISRNFGRYFSFLDARGELDPDVPLAEIVTPARIADYLREFKEMGYRSQSIILALSAVSCAMKILVPARDWGWIWRPNGISLAPHLKGPRKEFAVPHPSVLYRWGLELLTDADNRKRARDQLAQFRDGLIICLLAGRSARRRSLAVMQVDQHLVRTEAGWRLKLEPDDVKNTRWIEVMVPKTLTPWIDRYVAEIRPKLLQRLNKDVSREQAERAATAFWVSSKGTALCEASISSILWVRSSRRFETPFATHRFRHAVGTHAPVDDPEHPGIATSLLAIGPRMHEKHYNRARDHIAETRYQAVLARERARALPIAKRLLTQRQNAEKDNKDR